MVRKGGRPEIPEIVRDSELPVQARGPFKELLTLLVDHYTDLLRAEGDDFEPVILEGQAQDGIGIDLQTAPKLGG